MNKRLAGPWARVASWLIAVGLAVSDIYWMHAHDLTWNLLTIDWDAINAVAASGAAIAAVWAAWAAVRAARIALDIDRAQNERTRVANQQRATVMAVALDRELAVLAASATSLAVMASAAGRTAMRPEDYGRHDHAQLLQANADAITAAANKVRAPLLERYAENFVAFDDRAAVQLSNVLSLLLGNRTKEIDTAAPSPQKVIALGQVLYMWARATRREARIARRAIRHYRDIARKGARAPR